MTRATGKSWIVGLALLAATAAGGADAPRAVHGASDAFAEPGVALAWGILRGASEAATNVVIRIDVDAATYPVVSVVGVDPFTQARQPLLSPTRVAGTLDVRVPRARFSDYPRSELRLFGSAAAAAADSPALVVYYAGVPDTTPEFTDERTLDNDLSARIGRARGESGRKAP